MASTILLECGTNEVEILEFFLGKQSFGINVAKIAQIVPYAPEQLTILPATAPEVRGSLLWQGRSLPLIDLALLLHRPLTADPEPRPVVLVTAFNNGYHGFLATGVNRITRIGWDAVRPLARFLGNYSSAISGSIQVEGREILLIDFEYLVATLFPNNQEEEEATPPTHPDTAAKRAAKKIFLADDSPFIRETIAKLLHKNGYTQVQAFKDGREAWKLLHELQQKRASQPSAIRETVDLLISDIEMPEMDGLTLCRQLKKELGLTDLPVILFSSLVNSSLAHKCQEVGADGFTSKPEFQKLLRQMDQLLGLAPPPAIKSQPPPASETIYRYS